MNIVPHAVVFGNAVGVLVNFTLAEQYLPTFDHYGLGVLHLGLTALCAGVLVLWLQCLSWRLV